MRVNSDEIRRRLKELGRSQEWLADQLGMTKQGVSVALAKQKPGSKKTIKGGFSVPNIKKIAELLGYPDYRSLFAPDEKEAEIITTNPMNPAVQSTADYIANEVAKKLIPTLEMWTTVTEKFANTISKLADKLQ